MHQNNSNFLNRVRFCSTSCGRVRLNTDGTVADTDKHLKFFLRQRLSQDRSAARVQSWTAMDGITDSKFASLIRYKGQLDRL